MQINTAVTITYSPTGTTASICGAIAKGLAVPDITVMDLTPAFFTESDPVSLTDGMAVIGVPVYSGRVAATAVERLSRISADGIPVVLVVVYGNRSYEDALVELYDHVMAAGFHPVATAAFIGEHSFSHPGAPLAFGRPDALDLQQAQTLGKAVARRLRDASSAAEIDPPPVLGHRPYKDRQPLPAIAPTWFADRCTDCGQCVEACPVAAIGLDQAAADVSRCTLCCACVKVCPEQARVLDDPWLDGVSAKLTKACAMRQAPEIQVSSAVPPATG